MSEGKADEMKGRLKEAAGAVTGDDDMAREGREDQAKGKLKQASDKVGDAVDDIKDAFRK